jgi:two-component system LytT family response regulator
MREIRKDEKIRTIIVEDESIAREKLRLLLESEADVEIISECSNGQQGIATVRAQKPDLLFLDVHMPDLDGFEVLARSHRGDMPCVVFTTAFDKYALRAFEEHALDYLLKPFDQQRLHATMERVRKELRRFSDSALTNRMLDRVAGANKEAYSSERLVIKTQGRVVFLELDQIDWVDAEANYVRLYVGKESYLVRNCIGHISEQLESRNFVRIHRSTIVNVSRIKELHPVNSAEYLVVLKSGKQLSCSRGYRGELKRLIDQDSLSLSKGPLLDGSTETAEGSCSEEENGMEILTRTPEGDCSTENRC